MKLNKLLAVSFLSVFLSAKAQLSVQFNGINEYSFNTREALNLSILNTGSKSFEVVVQGKIKSADGQTVVELKSNPLMLAVGANIITPFNPGLGPVHYFNQDIAEIEAKTGTYPSGNYSICVWISCTSQDCNGAGSNAANIEVPVCTTIHIENPTPLLLNFPSNGSETDETRPLYTWIPPGPVAGSASLNYTMVLVEILDGQNTADALSLNRPLIELMGLGNPMLMHPSDLPALEPGKSYAWQVQAFVGQTPMAKSEQWKFKVKKDTLDMRKVPRDLSFVEIRGQTGASLFYAVGQLKLRHLVRMVQGTITYTIKDKDSKLVKTGTNSFAIHPGDNRIVLDLEKEMKFRHGETYTLTGTLLNGEPFIITFIYINPALLND